jgi:multiple sugar transport system ATP-binding protein
MKSGRIQQVGTPIEIYNNPANLFVAGFIGSPAMNFLRVEFDSEKGIATCKDGRTIVVPKALYEGKQIPKDVILGIRPEDFVQYDESTDSSYAIKVKVAELLGSEYYIHTNFGGIDLIVKLPAKQLISARQKLHVEMIAEKVHFFDPETEMVI